MNTLEIVLRGKIKELEPTLDIFGSDRKMLQIAHQDFLSYLKFTRVTSGKETEISDPEEIEFTPEEREELGPFLAVWLGMWLKKWKARVKLVFGNQSQYGSTKTIETLSIAESLLQGLDCKEEMTQILKSALIRNGEICGTEILAKYLLRTELNKPDNRDINDKERVVSILNNSLRRTREISKNKGPSIFLRIDKNYFKAATRHEWGDPLNENICS